VRNLSLTSIFTEATTTRKLELGRESFLLWRSAVYRYCRLAFDVEIGAGPGWTLAWRPRHDENERMVYPAWFNQSRDADLCDFVILTSDPAHEFRYNYNNPSRSGLQAVFNICQVYEESAVVNEESAVVYEESAVITMERGLAALRAIQQQDCLDGEALNLYSTQLAQATAVLKELPTQGLRLCGRTYREHHYPYSTHLTRRGGDHRVRAHRCQQDRLPGDPLADQRLVRQPQERAEPTPKRQRDCPPRCAANEDPPHAGRASGADRTAHLHQRLLALREGRAPRHRLHEPARHQLARASPDQAQEQDRRVGGEDCR
jgi:hypothetical protein